MPDLAFVNNKVLPIEEASISVEDRGFQFGDGVYEVIRGYNGKPFYIEKHLERLQRSLKEIDLSILHSEEELKEIINKLNNESGYKESLIYIQITRGVAPREHLFPEKCLPTIIVTVREVNPLPVEYYKNGVWVITVPDIRWGRCDIKSTNLLPNILMKEKAKRCGCFEAIFVDTEGYVNEATSCNVLCVKDGCLVTPPEGSSMLSGITREVIMYLTKREGIKVSTQTLKVEELKTSDEVFITGTITEIMPVVKIDKDVIGKGIPGFITDTLYRTFKSHISEMCK